MLRIARRIPERVPVDVVTTFLGAHTVPPEFDGDADGYIRFVCDEVLPAVAAEGLATRSTASASASRSRQSRSTACSRPPRLGLRVKLHADQLSRQRRSRAGGASSRVVGRSPRARLGRRHRRDGGGREPSPCCCRARPTCCATTPPHRSTRSVPRASRWRSPPTATRARRRSCRCSSPCTSPAPASASPSTRPSPASPRTRRAPSVCAAGEPTSWCGMPSAPRRSSTGSAANPVHTRAIKDGREPVEMTMTVREILHIGHPVLREEARRSTRPTCTSSSTTSSTPCGPPTAPAWPPTRSANPCRSA